jgi:hypothetical protein
MRGERAGQYVGLDALRDLAPDRNARASGQKNRIRRVALVGHGRVTSLWNFNVKHLQAQVYLYRLIDK